MLIVNPKNDTYLANLSGIHDLLLQPLSTCNQIRHLICSQLIEQCQIPSVELPYVYRRPIVAHILTKVYGHCVVLVLSHPCWTW